MYTSDQVIASLWTVLPGPSDQVITLLWTVLPWPSDQVIALFWAVLPGPSDQVIASLWTVLPGLQIWHIKTYVIVVDLHILSRSFVFFNNLMWVLDIRFVDIGGIVDHHFSNAKCFCLFYLWMLLFNWTIKMIIMPSTVKVLFRTWHIQTPSEFE